MEIECNWYVIEIVVLFKAVKIGVKFEDKIYFFVVVIWKGIILCKKIW